MITATRVVPASEWDGVASDTVVLDYAARHRRRIAMTGEGGLAFLLDLPEAVVLREGDGILLADGRFVSVSAAAENLVEITAPAGAGLARIAWHLGNRHLPTQIEGDRLLIRRDHVIEAMAARLGYTLREVQAGFHPEGGAYGHGALTSHSHNLSWGGGAPEAARGGGADSGGG